MRLIARGLQVSEETVRNVVHRNIIYTGFVRKSLKETHYIRSKRFFNKLKEKTDLISPFSKEKKSFKK